MSRRKQARPKSCKNGLENQLMDVQEDSLIISLEEDAQHIKDQDLQENGRTDDSSPSDTVAECSSQVSEKSVATLDKAESEDTPGSTNSTETPDSVSAKELRCETCASVFDSLDQFMDHRNFECGANDNEEPRDGSEIPPEAAPFPPASPSGASTSSGDTGESGTVAVDLDIAQEVAASEADGYSLGGTFRDNLFGCQFCEKAFAKRDQLKRHEQTHTVAMPYKCRHCPRLFRHKKSRERHERLHSGDRKYKCHVCGVGYSRSDHLRNHMKIHDQMENDQGFRCPVCQLHFMSASALTNHMKRHTRNSTESNVSKPDKPAKKSAARDDAKEESPNFLDTTEGSFDCEVCHEIFTTKDALETHRTHAHVEGEEEFKCPICLIGFPEMERYCQHLLSHNVFVNGSGDVTNSVKDMERGEVDTSSASLPTVAEDSRISRSSDSIVCPYCMGDGFESLESLELHLTSVHSVKPTEVYTCNYCNAPYPNLYSLHDHMTVVHRSQHGLDITYPCSMCVQRFHSLDALAKHKGIVHAQQRSTGIDAAFCNRCNMTLASPRSLEDHMANVHNIIMEKRPVKIRGKRSSGKSMKTTQSSKNTSSASKPSHNKPTGSKESASSSSVSPICKTPPTGISSLAMALNLSNSEDSQASSALRVTAFLAKKAAMSSMMMEASGEGGVSGMTCDHCNATFHDVQNFAAHILLHSDTMLTVPGTVPTQEGHLEGVAAPTVAKETASAKGMAQAGGSSSSSSTTSSSAKLGAHPVHDCFKCGASFMTEEQLEAHSLLHYLRVSTEYGCSTCTKHFSKPDELQRHLMDIHAHHLYRCSLCKEVFDSKVNIQVHFAIKHSDECKLYRCLSCDVTFRSEMEWQVHVRVNHLQISRPYRCLFCQESFTSEVELQCHLTTHSKPFTCPMCSEAFHIEYLLDQHMQQCHDDDSKPNLTGVSPHMTEATTASSPFYNHVNIKQEKEDNFLDSMSNGRSPCRTPNAFVPVINSPPCSTPIASSTLSRLILKSPTAPSPSKQPRLSSTHSPQDESSGSVNGQSSRVTPPIVSAIWKNTEPLHMCNICDVKFAHLSLLNIHKTQDHGLKAVDKTSNYRKLDTAPKSHQESSILMNNRALLSALSSSPLPAHQTTSPVIASRPATPLSCMFCSQTFKNNLEYDKHMKIHVNSGNLTCSICDETFTSASVLAEHKLTHCKIQQGNACVVCRVNLSNQEQFYMHSQEHGFEGTQLQCVVCRQSIASLVELQMHGRHHFQAKPTFFTCCVCLKSFESKENLISKLNASGRTYYVCKPCYHGEAAPLHTCSQCSEKFASAQLLETHKLTHKSSFQCIKCQEYFTTEYDIQLHVATHMITEGTQHDCRLCGGLFDTPARLQTHLIQHSFSGTSISCFVCDKTFESPQEIQVHALEHGSMYRKYVCPQCPLKFFFSAELENHKLVYNHGIMPALSPSSIASLSSSVLPSAHLNLFTSPSASFSMASLASWLSTASLLKSQEHALLSPKSKSHNSSAQEQPAHHVKQPPQQQTPQESSGAKSGSSGKKHSTLTIPKPRSSTTGFQCSECQKHFSTGTALANHRKTHFKKEAKNAVKCSVCDQTFATATAMQQHFFSVHSRTAEGKAKKQTGFECMLCEKECSSLAALQSHILTHRAETNEGPITDTDDVNDAGVKARDLELGCPVCEKLFASTEEIDDHLKTHQEVFTANVTDTPMEEPLALALGSDSY